MILNFCHSAFWPKSASWLALQQSVYKIRSLQRPSIWNLSFFYLDLLRKDGFPYFTATVAKVRSLHRLRYYSAQHELVPDNPESEVIDWITVGLFTHYLGSYDRLKVYPYIPVFHWYPYRSHPFRCEQYRNQWDARIPMRLELDFRVWYLGAAPSYRWDTPKPEQCKRSKTLINFKMYWSAPH